MGSFGNAHANLGLDAKETVRGTIDFFSYAAEFNTSSSMQAHAGMTWMAAMQEQLRVLKELGFEPLPVKEDIMFATNEAKGGRVVNIAFKNKIFRKVRLTYLDAGDKAQAFNSVFYPRYEYDLPLLGTDLISLGRSRIIAGVDFQPLYDTDEYNAKYVDILAPIRNKYENLQATHSGRIYNSSAGFSKNMLLGLFSDEENVDSEIIPASKEYLDKYLELVKEAVPDNSEHAMLEVQKRQARYDNYHAEVDPAIGFFKAYFGKEWAESFVHDFLFELAREYQDLVAVES